MIENCPACDKQLNPTNKYRCADCGRRPLCASCYEDHNCEPKESDPNCYMCKDRG